MSSWRKGVEKPAEKIVDVEVEPIITAEEFEEVQAIMRSWSPHLRAPRFVSGPTLLGGVAFCADCGGAMTLRTSGKGKEYRHYTCSTAARQGPKGCKGRSNSMDELNDLVVSNVVERLLSPDFLEEALGALLKRRDEAAERETGRIVALKRNALDAENKADAALPGH